MSALGHKQTFAMQNGMSALPPKADMCSATRMSAKCHKRTFELWQSRPERSPPYYIHIGS